MIRRIYPGQWRFVDFTSRVETLIITTPYQFGLDDELYEGLVNVLPHGIGCMEPPYWPVLKRYELHCWFSNVWSEYRSEMSGSWANDLEEPTELVCNCDRKLAGTGKTRLKTYMDAVAYHMRFKLQWMSRTLLGMQLCAREMGKHLEHHGQLRELGIYSSNVPRRAHGEYAKDLHRYVPSLQKMYILQNDSGVCVGQPPRRECETIETSNGVAEAMR